jgi:putative ABC transport system ATP-binding protein
MISTTSPTVMLSGTGKRYVEHCEHKHWAVRSATVAIYPGELTMLMGPSGSGKTTLLSMIGGLLSPTEGRVSVCGIALEALDETERQQFRRRYAGFIFQNYNLLASLTAEENVQVALALRGANESSAGGLLESVGLADKAESYPNQLSGGQRQRVAIVRALAGDPQIILADEPTAALDVVQGRRVMGLLATAAHIQRKTVIVVTHDSRVREYADRVIEMEDGRISRIVRRQRRQPEKSGHLAATRPFTPRRSVYAEAT